MRFSKDSIRYYFTVLDILYILKLFYTSFARFLLLVVRDAGIHDNRDRRPGRVRKKLDRKIGRKRAPCPSSGHRRHVQGHNAQMPETGNCIYGQRGNGQDHEANRHFFHRDPDRYACMDGRGGRERGGPRRRCDEKRFRLLHGAGGPGRIGRAPAENRRGAIGRV